MLKNRRNRILYSGAALAVTVSMISASVLPAFAEEYTAEDPAPYVETEAYTEAGEDWDESGGTGNPEEGSGETSGAAEEMYGAELWTDDAYGGSFEEGAEWTPVEGVDSSVKSGSSAAGFIEIPLTGDMTYLKLYADPEADYAAVEYILPDGSVADAGEFTEDCSFEAVFDQPGETTVKVYYYSNAAEGEPEDSGESAAFIEFEDVEEFTGPVSEAEFVVNVR